MPKPLGYSPCRHDDGNSVDCAYKSASEVLAAFHRNRNDADIERLFLRNITDMTDDILAEILDIVSTSASHKVHEIGLSVLPEVREVPESLMKFTNLESLYLEAMDKFKILPFGSIALPTNLTEIICVFNHNLKLIESGAFQGIYMVRLNFADGKFKLCNNLGNFDGTDINLSFNGLKKFDEAVFKPLLSDSTATIQFFFSETPTFLFK